jgi:hypothetical protein
MIRIEHVDASQVNPERNEGDVAPATVLILNRRHTFKDRRPCTTACPGCWAMGTRKFE